VSQRVNRIGMPGKMSNQNSMPGIVTRSEPSYFATTYAMASAAPISSATVMEGEG
jgi:hypothetical protein